MVQLHTVKRIATQHQQLLVQGGTFSATPSGLSINATTGAIDLDASTMGTYAVKYVTSSSIYDSTTFSVTLTATNTVSKRSL